MVRWSTVYRGYVTDALLGILAWLGAGTSQNTRLSGKGKSSGAHGLGGGAGLLARHTRSVACLEGRLCP